tara:strand:+ start:448 stop:897 length:450 start_codon:yes stop_codon:yes gene_type:complete
MDFEPTKLLAKTFSSIKRIPYLPIFIDEQLKIFTLFFRPTVFQKMIEIVKWTKKLPYVTSKYHKYGGLEFQVNGKEICHIHGDGLTDVLLTRRVANDIIKSTFAQEHHVISDSGWISYQIKKESDIEELKGIIKQSYSNKTTPNSVFKT